MLSILIADDHAVVRRGLKAILADEIAEVSFGEAESAPQALALVRQQPWDIVVLDISLPGRSGLEVLKEIKHECPKLPVLILSMHPEEQFAIRTLKAGAAGYLTKENAPEQLVQAVKKVIAGGKYVSDHFVEQLAATLATDSFRPPHEFLSDHEYEVMLMIASGRTVTEIAKELSLSVKTISTYRTRVLDKMGMHNSAELTHYAVSNQLVS
jgi:two-component system, NarL family, invasion response regulator UvrY